MTQFKEAYTKRVLFLCMAILPVVMAVTVEALAVIKLADCCKDDWILLGWTAESQANQATFSLPNKKNTWCY